VNELKNGFPLCESFLRRLRIVRERGEKVNLPDPVSVEESGFGRANPEVANGNVAEPGSFGEIADARPESGTDRGEDLPLPSRINLPRPEGVGIGPDLPGSVGIPILPGGRRAPVLRRGRRRFRRLRAVGRRRRPRVVLLSRRGILR
jgi:hypothetical protein